MGQKCIPGEDGGRLPVNDMVRGPAASQIVVVHGRKIVVDQGVGVDQLEGQHQRNERVRWDSKRLDGRQGEDRTNALSSRQKAVSYPLGETAVGATRFLPEEKIQGLVHPLLLMIQIILDVQKRSFLLMSSTRFFPLLVRPERNLPDAFSVTFPSR